MDTKLMFPPGPRHTLAILALGLSPWLAELPTAAQPAPVPPPWEELKDKRPPPPEPMPPLESAALTNMPMQQVSPGVFQIGKVRFDKQVRSVTFPALVNMREGMVEYFLVTTYGKTHESVLRTEAQPYHIHLAMLLLDAKGATNPAVAPGTGGAAPGSPSPAPGPVDHPGAQPISGERVTLEVSWMADGQTVQCGAHELVFNRAANAVMSPGPWIYNGSIVMDGLFVAQRDGLVASVISDVGALINNPRTGSENDEIWMANTNRVPAMNTPVEVIIRLPKAP